MPTLQQHTPNKEHLEAPLRPSSKSVRSIAVLNRRAVLEFFAFLALGLLLLEPVLELAGVSRDRAREGAFGSWGRSANENGMHNIYTNVAKFLRSPENPEVLIIGSSLVLWPALACDGFGTPVNPTRENCRLYFKAEYFRKLLEAKLAKRIDGLTSVSVPGTFMEDHTLIVTKALSQSKRPKLLIVAVHPAQFFRAKGILAYCSPLNLQLATVGDENQRSFSWEILRDRACMKVLAYKQERERLVLAAIKDVTERKKTRCKLIYQPFDSDSFEHNFLKLEEMSQAARRLGIPLLLVDMPVRDDNIAMIEKSHFAEYKRRVAAVASANDVKYFDSNRSSKYELGDFADFTHLSKQGGLKLYADLTEEIGGDPDLNRLL